MKKEFIKNNNLTVMVREHVIEEQRRWYSEGDRPWNNWIRGSQTEDTEHHRHSKQRIESIQSEGSCGRRSNREQICSDISLWKQLQLF